jgi:triacylglycerol lipase
MMPAAVFGFGLPRVGGVTFASRYNDRLGARTFRLVHGADIVARVPDGIVDVDGLSRLNARFRHVGRLLSCPAGGRFDRAAALADPNGNDPRFVAGARDNFRNRVNAALAGRFFSPTGPGVLGPLYALLPFAISDHLPDRYRRAFGD